MIKYILIAVMLLSSFIFAEYTRFTRLDSGIVVDHEYGLQWQDDINYTDEWIGAIDYCENLGLGGENDWRMPNINELLFIIETNSSEPTMNSIYKNVLLDNQTEVSADDIRGCGTGGDFYWSSTSSDANNSKAIGVRFNLGMTYQDPKKKYTRGTTTKEQNCSVRCVRSDFD